MTRINCHGKIRATAFFVCRIDRLIQTVREIRTDFRHQIPARRETNHSDLAGIDVPIRGM